MTLQPLSLNLNKNEDSLEFLEDEVFDISEFPSHDKEFQSQSLLLLLSIKEEQYQYSLKII